MKPEISVIVPIYKVEVYLRECIESILNQTYQDFELILVNDGSPDNCGAICDEYALKDGRIRVIHKRNGGVSAARNAGLEIATGEYIYFLDGDDFIDLNLLEVAALHMKTGVDMLVFNHRNYYEDGRTADCGPFLNGHYDISNQTKKRRFILDKLLTYKIGWAPWNRVFSHDVIKKYNLRFEDGESFAEDLYFCLCYCAHIENILVIADCLYNYRIRQGSAMDTMGKHLHIGRYNELGKAVLAHFQKWEDCRYLAENFYTIHYMIVTAHFLGAYHASGLTAQEFKKLAVANIEDWDFYRSQIKKQLKNWRTARPGFSEAEYMEQLCYMYYMVYDSYTIHRVLVKLCFLLWDRFDKENP